jgi:NAD(P)-dependent dehydrogenase (short-subunit alcohol dehydrogenase family)
LQDKSIVIIGGTSGLGLSAAAACIREGARLVVVGRSEEKCQAAIDTLGRGARAVVGDATDAAVAQRAVSLAASEFGQLDGLYHVAGGSGRQQGDGPLHEITNQGLHYTMQLNLASLFYSNRSAVQQFLRQGTGGSVLNISSVLANAPSPEYFATHAYAATKAAAIGLTKAAAAYYASNDIRFNAIAPALVATPLAQRACADEAIMRYIRSKQPLDGGRVGQPTDVDDAVIYFLSDQSRYVTGQTLVVDGGWSVTEGQI